MKQIFIISLFFVIALTTFGSYSMALAASQSESAIPQSGDLCGGTGGNGQIISVGNNTFTLKRNDDGRSQIIHLTNNATIKTSAGSVSPSDLKTGNRVTLVGGPNPDGSFTAYTVVVCSGTHENVTGQKIQSGQKRSVGFNKVNIWSSYINISTVFLLGLLWIGIVLFLRRKKKGSLVYLLFFTLFYVYIIKVLDYTLFQFQSLIILKHFMPDLILRGVEVGKSLNLMPLITLTVKDVRTSLLNILLMLPFGFGLPFITDLRMKRIVTLGALFSIVIEFLQLMTGLIGKMTFRIADINDVIFNTLGVAIGYILFIGLVRIYCRLSHNWKISAHPILQYIAKRPQIK